MSSTQIGPLMIDLAGKEVSAEDRELLLHPNVGGVILFSRNFTSVTQLRSLCAALRELPRQRLLIAVDYEGGRVQRFRHGFTRIPAMRTLGERYLIDAEEACNEAGLHGRTIADELGAFGIDLCFSPVLDRDCGISKVIGDRAFSDQVEVICSLAAAFRSGLAERGMAATGKHFPGHGAVAADSHTDLPVDGRSMAEIRAMDLEPFARLIRAGLESVMMAHVLYRQIDKLPASLSSYWIRQVLRTELEFSGAVFCDDLSMNGAAVIEDPLERLRTALDAGCDMVPVCNDRPLAAELVAALPVTADEARSERLARLYRGG